MCSSVQSGANWNNRRNSDTVCGAWCERCLLHIVRFAYYRTVSVVVCCFFSVDLVTRVLYIYATNLQSKRSYKVWHNVNRRWEFHIIYSRISLYMRNCLWDFVFFFSGVTYRCGCVGNAMVQLVFRIYVPSYIHKFSGLTANFVGKILIAIVRQRSGWSYCKLLSFAKVVNYDARFITTETR